MDGNIWRTNIPQLNILTLRSASPQPVRCYLETQLAIAQFLFPIKAGGYGAGLPLVLNKWLLRAGTDDKNPLFSLLVMNIVARCDGHGLWHWQIHTLGWEWALECFCLLRVVVIKNSACSSSHYFMACAFCIFANDPLKFAFRIKGADDSTITALQPYSMQSGSAERSSSSAH